jgi:hypothetical protein
MINSIPTTIGALLVKEVEVRKPAGYELDQ